jgi:hypothetical protein
VGLVLVLVAGLTAVAVRQVTVHLRGESPAPAAADQAGGEPADQAGGEPGDQAGGEPGDTGEVPVVEPAVAPGAVPDAAADLAPGTGSAPIIGDPVLTRVDRQPAPDRVSLQAGVLPPNLQAGQQGEAPPEESSGGEGGPFEAPVPGSNQRAPLPTGFGVGIDATVGGHFATIIVGVSGGPAGLAELSVDFGDGGRYQLPDDKLDQLRQGGTLKVVHRYEPTLDPTPHIAKVSAADGAGKLDQASHSFQTQAEFLLRFSPLTVTAREDCDTFGKGDFKLTWDLEGVEKSSRFDLGKGESYVENRFQSRIYGITHTDPYYYQLDIRELDAVSLPTEFRVRGPSVAEVVELGTYSYPVTHFWRTIPNDCRVRLDFTYHLTLFG